MTLKRALQPYLSYGTDFSVHAHNPERHTTQPLPGMKLDNFIGEEFRRAIQNQEEHTIYAA